MKRYLTYLGTYLLVQPSIFMGIAFLDKIGKEESLITTDSTSEVEYKNNQVIITKSNQKKHGFEALNVEKSRMNDMDNYLAKLENEPNIINGATTTTQLGQKMKRLSNTFLFTG